MTGQRLMGRLVALLGIGVGVLATPMAAAQNLVVNGDFDNDVDGWTELSIPLSWDPTSDYQNSPESGSALIVNAGPGSNSGAVQCINGIVAGEAYELSAWLRAPTGQSGQGNGGVFVWWYVVPNCGGSQTAGPVTGYITTSDSWVEVVAPIEEAPPGTQSAIVYLNNKKTSSTSEEYRVSFDHVLFTAGGVIFADGFEAGDTSAWSATVP
jgi:hypothetical protein